MKWSDRSTWQRIRLVLGWTLGVLFLLAATLPLWNVGIGNSGVVDRGLAEVWTLYSVTERYRSEHGGSNPPTLDALKPYLPAPAHTKYDEWPLTLQSVRANYRYDPATDGEQTLFTSHIDRYAAVWVTASGRAYVGRLHTFGIIWPKYEDMGRSRPIRW